ncbi:site-specific integrase [Labilibaculum sp. DW002]|uniref:Site-specific integrase n=1 Tax=Paralabilibaculum antarcticum TaxID=2912572 RepID=A0ABT5VUN5_9BACT|nr:site-specific integrase [Labilibaculum sp. DW002]MDE5419120.1 site-specific integrase [Labilibaculum sp. DW002]
MKASYKIVYNRKGKTNKEGKALLQLQVYLQKKQRYFSTGIYLKPKQWDESKRQVKNHPNQIRLNKQLRDLISGLEDFELKVAEEKKNFSFTHVENYLSGDVEMEFIEFCENELDLDATKKYSTYRAIKSKLETLKTFGLLQSFHDVDYTNIEKLDNWLRRKGLSDATVFKYHGTIKQFINIAIKKDFFPVQNNPYLKFKPKAPKTAKRKFLDKAQIKALREKKFTTTRLTEIRDVFLFSIYTGLAYADIATLRTKDLYTDENGDRWIWREREKTASEYKVPLLPQAIEILNRYELGKRLLPVKTNQKTNEYLKEIATLCEIEENLTFHMARHTFATTITLSNNVPIETVSKMLGHSDLKTTQIYAKVVDEKMKSDMDALRQKMTELY